MDNLIKNFVEWSVMCSVCGTVSTYPTDYTLEDLVEELGMAGWVVFEYNLYCPVCGKDKV